MGSLYGVGLVGGVNKSVKDFRLSYLKDMLLDWNVFLNLYLGMQTVDNGCYKLESITRV